jgi:hypothetical protein
MATLSNLKQVLVGIRDKILERPAFLTGTGALPDDAAYDKEIRIFEDLESRLSIAMRELKSKANLLQLQRQNLPGVSREDRYRQAASIESQEKETREAIELANQVRDLLNDTIRKNSTFSSGDIAHAAVDNIQHQYHFKEAFQQMVEVSGGPVYKPASNEHADTIEAATILVFLALQGFIKALKTLRKGTYLL